MVAHRTYRAAAKDWFLYADYDGGDGPWCVVRKCARYYRRGYTYNYWRRWHLRLFQTEEEAVAYWRIPCGDGVGGYSDDNSYCTNDHFIFCLAVTAKKPKPVPVPKEKPPAQRTLF
jgi:hypothetical protein